MNIETVNELIQSLESAGEMSIKERKYLDVMRWAVRVAGERDAALNADRVWERAMMEVCGEDSPASVASEIRSLRALRDTAMQALKSQVDQLAAENVGLKAGVTYFAYSPEYGFDYFKDKQSAIDTAQAEIDAYREDVDDGWSEDVQRVSWGVVIQQAQGFDAQGLHTSDSQHTYQTCDYRLVDSVATPATDRIVAGIKAAIEYPKNSTPSNGWTIDPEFLSRVAERASALYGYHPGLEETESALLAGLDLLREGAK